MRRFVTYIILLIQFCIQFIPLSFAEESIDVVTESGSVLVTESTYESGTVIVPPSFDSGSVLMEPSSETGALAAQTGSLLAMPDSGITASGSSDIGSSSSGSSVSSFVPNPNPHPHPHPITIVVSEVMWMGSNLSTADEWVEIAAFSSGSVAVPRSVSGWTLVSVKAGVETTLARLPDRTLGSGATFVIANTNAASSRLLHEPSVVTTAMSLPNTQLLLRLKNASDSIVDEVDDGVGAPMAGANPSGGPKASMERVNPWALGNATSSWKTSTLSIGFDDGLPLIFGTPGSLGEASVIVAPNVPSIPVIPENPPVGVPVLPVQAPPLVRLTEVLANPFGADTDEWLEIGSFDAVTVDLSLMTLRMGTNRFALSGVLQPGEHLRFGKVLTGLSLANSSGSPELLWRDKIIDAWTYGETPEGVSSGRSIDGVVSPQCVPSPDAPNVGASLDPFIRVQSSSASAGKASFNLEAAVPAGSMAGATCTWTYPDGYASGSCNPPSHSMVGPIYGDVILTMRDYCGNTMTRFLRVEIAGKFGPKEDDAFACIPTAFTGVTVSELLPNPTIDEEDGEWIELANPTDIEKPLCGWSLDDDEWGSAPYRLDRLRLPPGERLVFARPDTGIALNNDVDAVRLFAPLPMGGSGAYEIVRYAQSPEGKSFARRDDGVLLWTTPTPGEANAFEALRLPASVDVRIVQAMPNPGGKDSDGGEWIELRNDTRYPLPLTGWALQTASDDVTLGSLVLGPQETLRLDDRIPLVNTDAFVRLLDRDRVVVSTIAWDKSEDGRSVSVPRSVAHVSDLSFVSSDDCISWNAADVEKQILTVQMSGIVTEEITECVKYVSALLKEKKFDQEMYSYSSGSVLRMNGIDVASILLREGLVIVDEATSTPFHPLYRLDEAEARRERRGMWTNPDVSKIIDERRLNEDHQSILAEQGLRVKMTPQSGVVSAGTLITITTNVPAQVFIVAGTGAWQTYVEPIEISGPMELQVQAIADAQSTTGATYVINSFQPYDVLKSRYHSLRISEVYPSPKAGEQEWVELWNPTSETVSLVGWSIDDVEDAGSKPVSLSMAGSIGSGEYVLVEGLSVAWNNAGDQVRLIAPNGKLSHGITYGAVKQGSSYALLFGSTKRVTGDCATVHPTPGMQNRCTQTTITKVKKATRKKVAAKEVTRKVKYRNVVNEEDTFSIMRPLFTNLVTAAPSIGFGLGYAIFCLSLGLIPIFVALVYVKRVR